MPLSRHGRMLWVLLAVAGPLAAQEPYPLQRVTGDIRLDGRVDEPAWEGIDPFPLWTMLPVSGNEPSERTELRVGYDDDYLYLSCRMYDTDVSGIRATSLRRDDGSFSNDWCVIGLDTFNDKETMQLFATSPNGIRTDAAFTGDGLAAPNFSWGTFWDADVSRSDEGWSGEIRIPLSSLRFVDDDGRVVMGLTAWRNIARKNEVITFPEISDNWSINGVFKASLSREVVMDGVFQRKPLYVTPYALGGGARTHSLNELETAWDRSTDVAREVGLDVKYGLASNLTLDLSVNTDFAQVEADDQQVNLTRFSLFFPERRLFFQERASVFNFSLGGSDRVFYSRRIGLEGGEQVRILGGARLVGRVGPWDVGFLDMHTDKTVTSDGTLLPYENFGVLRLRRQVLNPNSYVGGILTSRVGSDGAHNMVYGLDGIIRLARDNYLIATWAQSFDDGDTDGGFEDSFARLRLERRGQDGLVYTADVSRAGSTFDPAAGFLRRKDYVRFGDEVSYGWRASAESPLLRHALSVSALAYRRNDDGRFESAEVGPLWTLQTKTDHLFGVGSFTSYENITSEFSLVGGLTVPAANYTFTNAFVNYRAPISGKLRGSVRLEGGAFYDGRRFAVSASPSWAISKHVLLSPTYRMDRVEFQDRSELFTAHVARFRIQTMFSTKLIATSFVQYSNASELVVANVRVRYNPREGTDLYLVINETQNTDRFGYDPIRPLSQARAFLVKYSYTFNVQR